MTSIDLQSIARKTAMSFGALLPALAFLGCVEPGVAASTPAEGVKANSAPVIANVPGVWDVAIDEKGTHCVLDPDSIRFWRADSTKPARLRVYGPANAPSQIVSFAAGEAVAMLDPSTFPIVDGSTMTISDPSSGVTFGNVDFAIVTVPPGDPHALSQALSARGCTSQLERVTGSFPKGI